MLVVIGMLDEDEEILDFVFVIFERVVIIVIIGFFGKLIIYWNILYWL